MLISTIGKAHFLEIYNDKNSMKLSQFAQKIMNFKIYT